MSWRERAALFSNILSSDLRKLPPRLYSSKVTQHEAIVVRHQNNPCYNPCGGASGGGGGGGGKSKHELKIQPYKTPPSMDHDAKNMALNRPMSPHLTIYAPTMPAMTSIGQRMTGVMLTGYATLLASGSLFLSNGVESYVCMIQSLDLSRPMIFIIKLILGAPFAFHYCNGIRFCLWNAGKFLTKKEVYATAKTCFLGTAALTVLFAFL